MEESGCGGPGNWKEVTIVPLGSSSKHEISLSESLSERFPLYRVKEFAMRTGRFKESDNVILGILPLPLTPNIPSILVGLIYQCQSSI